MGASFSHLRKYFLRAIIRILYFIPSPLGRLIKRITSSPGIPVPNPSLSYWSTPSAPVATRGSGPDVVLPEYADILIIGSGITGTSVARTILDYDASIPSSNRPLQVVMLEARDACSGATGRNGGHITPVQYQDYVCLRHQYGPEIAAQIIRFRLSHLNELLTVAAEEGLLEHSQCRTTQSYDVFKDKALYHRAKDLLGIYTRDLPTESSTYQVVETDEALADLQLSPSVVGCLSTLGGAVHPYRLVTGILTRLLQSYPSSFHLFTHTPCTAISPPTGSGFFYTVYTPKQPIRARHIIHATNAWASHLLPGMRGRILPARGVMTAQLPRPGLGKAKYDWTGMRSFVLYSGASFGHFDYLTQQLPTASQKSPSMYPPASAELMLGGGFMRNNAYLTELGSADDSAWNSQVADYLSGSAMDEYFRASENDQKDTVIGKWSGILAVSTDGQPWVGRVPESISLRRSAPAQIQTDKFGSSSRDTINSSLDGEGPMLTPPGEWIAAGYSGEGMVHAWLSGKAVAYMVLGLDQGKGDEGEGEEGVLPLSNMSEWLPEVFRITEKRHKNAGLEEMLASYVW